MIKPSIRLRRAILTNDVLLVKRILKSHPSLLHNPDSSLLGLSNSNLHLAASLGQRDICAALLDAGHERPCPAVNERWETALMIACKEGKIDVVRLLIDHHHTQQQEEGGGEDEKGGIILRRDIKGRDAIMHASANGHDDIVQLLLSRVPGGAGRAIARADVDGNTALHMASGSGKMGVLRTLLDAGADVERRNVWNWTAGAYCATVKGEVYLKGLVGRRKG